MGLILKCMREIIIPHNIVSAKVTVCLFVLLGGHYSHLEEGHTFHSGNAFLGLKHSKINKKCIFVFVCVNGLTDIDF